MPERITQPYQQIDVAQYIGTYNIENPTTIEALQAHPGLSFLLGKVTDEPQTRDTKFDGVERDVYFLTEGSGMYGLTHPDDAMRWRGIFNHIVGTARQVDYMSQVLAGVTDEQKQAFADRGYDIGSFDEIDPKLLVEFMLVSHSGRRGSDEQNWYGIEDEAHTSTDPGESSAAHLKKIEAPAEIQELMRAESHDHFLTENSEAFPNIVDNILTYCDWTFGQRPNTLVERFDGLRASNRLPTEILNQLEVMGTSFEQALIDVLGQGVIDQMKGHHWKDEALIREGYCAPSGLDVAQAFPEFAQRQELLNPTPQISQQHVRILLGDEYLNGTVPGELQTFAATITPFLNDPVNCLMSGVEIPNIKSPYTRAVVLKNNQLQRQVVISIGSGNDKFTIQQETLTDLTSNPFDHERLVIKMLDIAQGTNTCIEISLGRQQQAIAEFYRKTNLSQEEIAQLQGPQNIFEVPENRTWLNKSVAKKHGVEIAYDGSDFVHDVNETLNGAKIDLDLQREVQYPSPVDADLQNVEQPPTELEIEPAYMTRPSYIVMAESPHSDDLVPWIGIRAEGPDGKEQNYLYWNNITIDVEDDKAARIVAAQYLAQLKVEMGVDAALGVPIDLSLSMDPAKGIYIEDHPRALHGVYIAESNRPGFNLRMGLHGELESAEQLQRKYPDEFKAAYENALKSLPRLRTARRKIVNEE